MGWLTEKGGCIFINIHLQPRASKNEIVGIHGESIKVRLTSPPVEGAANSHAIEFFAKKLGIQKSKITIVSGEKSRHKTLKIEGLTKSETASSIGLDIPNQ
ncbi:MAG: hypothetical protein HW415_1505 [Deltaproteobacteria bacterium]|nr:hypothetical protein [Deltaproteobacteria bacterium]